MKILYKSARFPSDHPSCQATRPTAYESPGTKTANASLPQLSARHGYVVMGLGRDGVRICNGADALCLA